MVEASFMRRSNEAFPCWMCRKWTPEWMKFELNWIVYWHFHIVCGWAADTLKKTNGKGEKMYFKRRWTEERERCYLRATSQALYYCRRLRMNWSWRISIIFNFRSTRLSSSPLLLFFVLLCMQSQWEQYSEIIVDTWWNDGCNGLR